MRGLEQLAELDSDVGKSQRGHLIAELQNRCRTNDPEKSRVKPLTTPACIGPIGDTIN